MRRGDVYWVNFEPALGGEVRKKRPAIIVSNDSANKAANRVQVIPLSSNVNRIGSWEARVTVGGNPHKEMVRIWSAMASRERLLDKEGEVSGSDMAAVERAIRVQLALA